MIRARTTFDGKRLLAAAHRLAKVHIERPRDGSHWRDARRLWPYFGKER